MLDLKGTGVVPKSEIKKIITEVFDLRPAAIVEYLDLLRPIYRKTSAYGHFGRNEPEFSWEQTNMADIIREKAGI
jgi:S-adenosylmethionine synthetase